ncbi:FkbM family methyltransferase [Nonomuraea angiospora]|uniref:FkbM family methyltransferase n=1 Tax=Nonomuraea angiospora TaxID=46172 RepID=UPI0033190E4F
MVTLIKRLRQGLAIRVMRAARAANRSPLARRLLRGRSIRRFALVNRLYHTVFRLGVATGDRDAEARYRGVVLTGPAWDATIMPSVSAGYYEEFEVGVFERLASISRSVLDVGANIGVYTCTGAARLPEDGSLIAFEPVPENIGYLRRNVERNDLADGGLGPPDLIKIDVEGYEGFVLRGAAESLAALPALLFEVHPELQENCGCAAGELLDLVFDRYPWVFVIDELDNVLRPCTRAELDDPHAIGLYRSNLAAVGRPEHLDALRQWHGLGSP